jgi:hypothetical protein
MVPVAQGFRLRDRGGYLESPHAREMLRSRQQGSVLEVFDKTQRVLESFRIGLRTAWKIQ